ncbi:major facilitator superfamily domain-containing protein [Naematelia encephala]|uniref:Major facilitator superfamily domain-containing protein n=1 Tax=Naematelia encephala TaxID=71784 RepID=A0A1Y2B2F5_9TREE|nr:major facilitator superfamily domain-containing protein [Naematelia encephala]
MSRPSSPPPHLHHTLSRILSMTTAAPSHRTHSRTSHFSLAPIRSNLLDDGLDNIPPPLPHDHKQLERRLTQDPDVERQMRGSGDGEIGPPPEGGREAWLVVASSFFILFCVFGFVTSFGTLQVYYLSHQLLGYSKSQVAWISSVQMFLTFAGSIFAGRIFDSHGARGLAIAGSSLSVGAIIAIAFCKEYYQLMLGHAAFGLSGSILYSPGTAIAGHWFMRRRSTATGIVVCGSGLGGVIYPIALKRLFDQLSFRDTMLIIAGMNAFLMLPSWFFMKARLPPRQPPPLRALLGPWKEPRYAFLVIGSCMIMMNWVSPYFNAPTLATSNYLPTNIASYSVAILQAGSFTGRALSGVLADAVGVWHMYVLMALLQAVVIFAFWTASPLPAAAVVVGLAGYGFASGAWITLVAASMGAISPTREFGMRLGMLWSLSSIPLLIGPVICGVLVGVDSGKFSYAAIFCGFTFLIGAALAVSPRALEMLAQVCAQRKRSLQQEQPREGEEDEGDKE